MTTTETSPDKRSTFIDNLHQFAELLATHSDLPLPYRGNELMWFVHGDPAPALALAAVMDGPTLIRDPGTFPVSITGTIVGFKVTVYVDEKAALAQPAAVQTFPALVPALAALVDPVKLTSVSL